jgi:hypothetical protein
MSLLDDAGLGTFYLAASSVRRSFLTPLFFLRSQMEGDGLTYAGSLRRAIREILKESLCPRRAFNVQCVREDRN